MTIMPTSIPTGFPGAPLADGHLQAHQMLASQINNLNQQALTRSTRFVSLGISGGSFTTVTAGGPIPFDTITRDNHGDYNLTTQLYTVAVEGTYICTLVSRLTSTTPATDVGAAFVAVNGNRWGIGSYEGPVSNIISLSLYQLVQANPGDTLQLRYGWTPNGLPFRAVETIGSIAWLGAS